MSLTEEQIQASSDDIMEEMLREARNHGKERMQNWCVEILNQSSEKGEITPEAHKAITDRILNLKY